MTDKPTDSLDGKEQQILDSLLSALWPKAKTGDEAAIDRVLKILELKRKYRQQAEMDDL